jgi:hypothetical protein
MKAIAPLATNRSVQTAHGAYRRVFLDFKTNETTRWPDFFGDGARPLRCPAG